MQPMLRCDLVSFCLCRDNFGTHGESCQQVLFSTKHLERLPQLHTQLLQLLTRQHPAIDSYMPSQIKYSQECAFEIRSVQDPVLALCNQSKLDIWHA